MFVVLFILDLSNSVPALGRRPAPLLWICLSDIEMER